MEKRIALELMRRSPSEIKELNLDNCRSTQIFGLTDEYINLQMLSLNNVGLTTLKGFPSLPKLSKLELSDNRISNGLNFLNGCKNLAHLNLSNNRIKDLQTLKPLEEFRNLKNLDLYNNEITNIEEYRTKMFDLLPTLRYLDGFDQDDQEVEDSEAEEDEMNGNNESEESGEDEEGGAGAGLSTLYNTIEEESSDSSLYDGSDVEEEEEEDGDEEIDGENYGDGNTNSKGRENSHGEPEESTRGKKRKHEDDEEN